ncbi:hypothetical protein QR680_001921 [Steinernema hermaphroditum]|uniref:ETS domain-containing protein n=1 Tax=Steinernema hermaphroditum TaxID=289476 RepID=A0AA39H0J6_9BILA|nr:hypothetical protein QR680_001921 [Steinernema hermaphroditum]
MKKFSATNKFEQDCPAIASSPPPSAPFPFQNPFAATTTTSLSTEYLLAALASNTQLEYPNLGLATSLGLTASSGTHLLTGQQPIGETTQVVGFPAAQTSTLCAQVSPPPPGTAANNTGTALSAGGLPVCPTPTTNLVYPQPSPFLQSPSSNILPSAFSIVTAAQSSAPQGLQSTAGYNSDTGNVLPSQLVPPNLISSQNNLVAPNSTAPQANSNVITSAAAAALYPQLMCLPALFDRLTPAILRSQMSSSQFKPIPNNERVDLVRFRLNDPKDWAMDDVVAWMLDVARRNSIPLEDMNMQKFASCNGPQLLAMNEIEFKQRDPAYGSLLFCELRKLVSEDSFIDELLRTPCDEDKQQAAVRRVPLTHEPPPQCGLLSPGNPLSLFAPTSPLLQSMTQQLQPPPTQTPQMQHSPISSKPIPVGVPHALSTKFHLPGPSSSSASFDSTGCDESGLHGVNLKIRKNKDGRPRKRSQHTKGNKLWEFIRDALKDPSTCPSVVRWEDPIEGVFRIVESEKLARLWGEKKNNQKMTYEKLSRAMRTYYEKQILVPVPKTGLYPKKYYYNTKILLPVSGRRLVYRFGPNAQGWRDGGVVMLNDGGSLTHDYHGPAAYPLLAQTGGNYLHCSELCLSYDESGDDEFDEDDEIEPAFLPTVPVNMVTHSTVPSSAFEQSSI